MTAISITEVTSSAIPGTGAFDKIMSAMQVRLEEEFNQGRITGDDYANVYLGAMTACMQQAVAFVLGKQNAASQVGLTDAQTLEVNAQIANIAADTANKVKQGLLLDKQVLEVVAQTALLTKQALGVEAETLVKGKQGILLDKQALESAAQTANISAETLNKPKQGVILDKQALEIQAKISNITADTTNKAKEGRVLDEQADKLVAEELFIKHKSANEQAQRSDSVTDVDGVSRVVVGVIGKQKTLYQAQTDGFARDAEQKLAKILVDTWNVRRTTDSGLSTSGTGLEDSQINVVLAKAKDGIGL